MSCRHSTLTHREIVDDDDEKLISIPPLYSPPLKREEAKIYTRSDVEEQRKQHIDKDYQKFRGLVLRKIEKIPSSFSDNLSYNKWHVTMLSKWKQEHVDHFCDRFNAEKITDLILITKKKNDGFVCLIKTNAPKWEN